jgi:hypothetical protein
VNHIRVRDLIREDVVNVAKGLLYEVGVDYDEFCNSTPLMDEDGEDIGIVFRLPGPWVAFLLQAAGWMSVGDVASRFYFVKGTARVKLELLIEGIVSISVRN